MHDITLMNKYGLSQTEEDALLEDFENEEAAEKLAVEINAIKQQTTKAVLLASIEIGEKLCKAKSLVNHGDWAKWLSENVDYSQSTANELMKLYREYGDNQLDLFSDGKTNSEIFGNLTKSQAIALFALPSTADRIAFVESHDMSEMSVRDIDKAIKEKEEAEAIADSVRSERDELAELLKESASKNIRSENQIEQLLNKIKELEHTIAAEAAKAPIEAECERGKIEAEFKAKYQKEADEKIEKLKQKHKKELEKVTSESKSLSEGFDKKLEEEAKRIRSDAEAQAKSDAEAEVTKLREALEEAKAASNEHLTAFKIHFEQLQTEYRCLSQIVSDAEADSPELGAQLKNMLDLVIESLGGLNG